jgi:hypothetical protein
MRKYAGIIMVLLMVSPLSQARAAMSEEPAKLPPDRIELQDGPKEEDCDCCLKCKAAKRTITPKEEAGATPKNGCADCCDRCGKALPLAPEESPPDIIEKPKQ